SERSRMAYIVDYDTETDRWAVIEPLQSLEPAGGDSPRRVVEVGWLVDGTDLLVRHEVGGKPGPGTIYTLEGGHWVGRMADASVRLSPAEPPSMQGLMVRLHESANEPPIVVASDGQHELPLMGVDPAFKGVHYTREEPFEWLGADGKMNVGGLLLPESARTQRVPLVIQAYTYDPN